MPKRVAFFFSSFRVGGIEKGSINLAREFVRQGINVDLVVVSGKGELIKQVHNGIRIIDLGASRTLFAIPALIRYLNNIRPDAVLSSQTHNNCVAIIAKKIIRSSFRLVVSEHMDISVVAKDQSLKEKLRPIFARLLYPYSDAILAVSQGASHALSITSAIPMDRIQTIYNPVVTPELFNSARENVNHPWLLQKKYPVILSVGRLSAQKDFANLLLAFSLIINQMKAYLIILGEGSERVRLISLARKLGIDKYIDLPGYKSNPYAYMSKANVFVVSSTREGLSNVLIEAMACGTPVVSTNCPSGPAEILENGLYGRLTPVDCPSALANAIIETLNNPIDSSILKKRALNFTIENIAPEYLKVLLAD